MKIKIAKATPFEGRMLFGKNMLTVCDGKVVYRADNE